MYTVKLYRTTSFVAIEMLIVGRLNRLITSTYLSNRFTVVLKWLWSALRFPSLYLCFFVAVFTCTISSALWLVTTYLLGSVCCHWLVGLHHSTQSLPPKNVPNSAKQQENEKYRQRTVSLQKNTPPHTFSGSLKMIERDYFFMSPYIVFLRKSCIFYL